MATVSAVVHFKRLGENGVVVDAHICLHGIDDRSNHEPDEFGIRGRVSGAMKDEAERRFQEYIAAEGYTLVGGHRGEFIRGGIP